jgi:predicted transcriptional regulator
MPYPKRHPSRAKGLEKFFGELELAVMEIIWCYQPVTVGAVLEKLNQDDERSWAYTTIMTVMGRLAEKGWLEAEKEGRAFVYTPVYSREETMATLAGDVVRSLLEDFGDVAVAQFAKELDRVNPEQLARLADLAGETEEDE